MALFINAVLHFLFFCTSYYKKVDESLAFVQYMSLAFLFQTTKKLLSLNPSSFSSIFSALTTSKFCTQYTHFLICNFKGLTCNFKELLKNSHPPNLVCSLRKTCWTTSPSFPPGNPDMFMDFYLEILTERYLRSFPTFLFQKTVQINQVLDLLGQGDYRKDMIREV